MTKDYVQQDPCESEPLIDEVIDRLFCVAVLGTPLNAKDRLLTSAGKTIRVPAGTKCSSFPLLVLNPLLASTQNEHTVQIQSPENGITWASALVGRKMCSDLHLSHKCRHSLSYAAGTQKVTDKMLSLRGSRASYHIPHASILTIMLWTD